jgi:hypothetical protein
VVKAPEEGTTDEPPAYRPGGFIGPPKTKIRDEQKYSESAIRKRTKITTTHQVIPQSPEQAQEGNFGVVTDHGKYYVAQLTKNGLAHLYECKSRPNGTFNPIFLNEDNDRVAKTKSTEGELWPLVVAIEKAKPVIPFWYSLSRGKMSADFRLAAKSILEQLS